MNNTRKEIINLIQDYMDKTLSEWCLIIHNNSYVKMKDNVLYEWKNIIGLTNWLLVTELRLKEWIWNKILWHYENMALLKYIKSKNIRLLKFDWEDFIYRAKEADFIIKWKPLNLYNEQEEKDLLQLLLKLK